MKHLPIALSALVLLGASPAPAPGIKPGLVLNDTLGQTVNGWLHASGAMFTVLKNRNGVWIREDDCCVATFQKGQSYIIARTLPLTRSPNGGVIKERVLETRRIDVRPGEEGVGCNAFGLQFHMSLKNPKTLAVRSVVIHDGKLGLLEWKDNGNYCEREGD